MIAQQKHDVAIPLLYARLCSPSHGRNDPRDRCGNHLPHPLSLSICNEASMMRSRR